MAEFWGKKDSETRHQAPGLTFRPKTGQVEILSGCSVHITTRISNVKFFITQRSTEQKKLQLQYAAFNKM